MVILQSNGFNASRIATTIGTIITSNLRLVDAPGNVLLPRRVSGLPKDSIINVSQIVTIDREQLLDRVGALPSDILTQVERGVRFALAL